MKKYKSYFLGLIIGLIIGFCGSVAATILINSNIVKFDKTQENILSSDNVQDAIDELDLLCSPNKFFYTGGIQSFVVPKTGTYKLEVWGAQGGSGDLNYSQGSGGKGGYSSGTVYLIKDQILYIAVGGQGANASDGGTGGYNGGGNGSNNSTEPAGGGGGATHIASISGTLASIGSSNKSDVYIVAGGGGGGGWMYASGSGDYGGPHTGGAGGGTSGGDAWAYGVYGHGGTQTQSPAANKNHYQGTGGFGYGGTVTQYRGAGGGGGLYGGSSGTYYNGTTGGGGGSGYIGGVENGVTEQGYRSGNGYARITYIPTQLSNNKSFEYNGSIQSYVVPKTGKYKLEVWGAQGGGSMYYAGGKGGYSKGEVVLEAGDILYIAVGGAGSQAGTGSSNTAGRVYADGGYNGGGTASTAGDYTTGSGGGATHIALGNNRGELYNYSANQSEILIVAGGGGGGDSDKGYSGGGIGGAGGGSSGQDGIKKQSNTTVGGGGTQTAGGSGLASGSFGKGANYAAQKSPGGGGGWYGGGTAENNPAGGGSGYIGDLLNASTSVGNTSFPSPTGENETGHSGNGAAKITFIG